MSKGLAELMKSAVSLAAVLVSMMPLLLSCSGQHRESQPIVLGFVLALKLRMLFSVQSCDAALEYAQYCSERVFRLARLFVAGLKASG